MPVDQQKKLDQIQDSVMQIKSIVTNDRIFNILEVVRDEVNDLSRQQEAIRSDIRDLRNLIFQQSATGAD